jgi:DNA-directed RNA polymerase III subunit RPC1
MKFQSSFIKTFKHIGNSSAALIHRDDGKIEKKDIDSVSFDFMSEEEIKNWSVVEITSYKFTGINTLFDPKMGPTNFTDNCTTCGQNSKTCPGHCGRIVLPRKVPHPLRLKLITQFLSLFCHNCYHLVISDEKMQLTGISSKSSDVKFRALLTERENCNTCPQCSMLLPSYSFDDDCKIYMKYKAKNSVMQIEKIDKIFGNIPPCDIKLIGLDEHRVHPSNFLISSLLVLPPCARPPVRNDAGQNHDDLTYKYIEILKHIEAYNKQTNSFERNKSYDSICFNIKTYMDNSKGKAKNQGQKRVIKCIKKRMTSKTGLIRGNLQGKRVNFCARSVISPEVNGWVDELVVPEKFAKNLTFPVKVNKINLKKCQTMLNENKVSTVIRDGKQIFIQYKCFTKGFELRDNDIIKRTLPDGTVRDIHVYGEEKPELVQGDSVMRYNVVYKNVEPKRKKEDFILREGDTIERYLQDGDWTLFNRQPTLWKYSMRAFRVKIRPGKTFRFNLACTASYNADFDKSLSKTGGLKRLQPPS